MARIEIECNLKKWPLFPTVVMFLTVYFGEIIKTLTEGEITIIIIMFFVGALRAM